MKPARFEYVAPHREDEALALLAEHADQAKVLAGGQSLIPLLNLRLAQPELLVDINRLSDLAYVRDWNGGIAIGALTRQHAVERSTTVRSRFPVIAEACHLIGHLPIRHRGTIGGNLAHADPASELPAVMLALEAEFTLASRRGRRTVPAQEFFTGPLTTALEPWELLTEIRIRGLPPRTGGAVVEFARRAGDYALVGVAALVTLDVAGRCEHARLALCGVGSTAMRAQEAERALGGETLHARVLHEAAERAAAAIDPPTDIHAPADFRRKLTRHFVRHAIEIAVQRAGGA